MALKLNLMRVFVVKVPETFQNGKWVPKFTPVKAEAFGRIIKLLGSGASLVVDDYNSLQKGLNDFNEDDYLLLLGSPLQMGIATHIAMRNIGAGGIIKFLVWDNFDKSYNVQEVLCG